MAPAGQGQTWSDVLCCSVCSKIFDEKRRPVNLVCGHVICSPCRGEKRENVCHLDEMEGSLPLSSYPINSPLLTIATEQNQQESLADWTGDGAPPRAILIKVERVLMSAASYLKRAESERGGTVYSESLSRTMQRKLVCLLCLQLVEDEGRARALKTGRAMADRVMTEVLLSNQVPSHLSTQLWTAVRARGCQFLGPAMQEDVLKLILLALGEGAPIARKTLVMYVVQMLTEDYPQVSKTCVGHVVQLLYRASCFHVLKREGESSLMQLKDEFRVYDALRKEHDAQIVQMAMEAGLRISPDQWSALLYGDQQHRSHMQSIIDKLQSPQSYQQGLDELKSLASKGGGANERGASLERMLPHLRLYANIHPTHHEHVPWARFAEYMTALSELLVIHSQYSSRRAENRSRGDNHQQQSQQQPSIWRGGAANGNGTAAGRQTDYRDAAAAPPPQHRFKTKMCRDVMTGQQCPRGNRCTWAHSSEEMREAQRGAAANGYPRGAESTNQQPPPPPMTMTVVGNPPAQMSRHHLVGQPMPMVPVMGPSGDHAPLPPHPSQMPGGGPPMMGHQQAPPPPPQMQLMHPGGPPMAVPPQMGNFAPMQAQVMPPVGPGEVVPMVPMVVHSPSHHHGVPMQGTTHMLVMSHQPGGPVVVGGPPSAPIWQPAQPMLVQHNSPPHHMGGTTFWIPQPPLYPMEQAVPLVDDGGCAWPRDTVAPKADGGAAAAGVDPLIMKRNEILSRLAPLRPSEDDEPEDGCVGHVSYTVASSVLDERMDLLIHPPHPSQPHHHPLPLMVVGGPAPLELPPIPVSFSTVIPNAPTEETMIVMGDMAVSQGRPRAPSLSVTQIANVTTVLTACPASLLSSESAPTATVQANRTTSTMHMQDTMSQPLATPFIQRSQGVTMTSSGLDMTSVALEPSIMSDRLPAPPVVSRDPQGVVSNTLDKIVDVKERLNEAEGAPLSCAVSQQLRVELRIAEREMDQLDPRTQASCLLRELQQVDRQIEQMEAARPVENC